MNDALARRLCALNSDFYRRQAESFSRTRRSPWHGWRRCLDAMPDAVPAPGDRPFRVLDVACGNLRFEAFLEEALPGVCMECIAVDDCDALAASAHHGVERPDGGPDRLDGGSDRPDGEPGIVRFRHMDVVSALLGADGSADAGLVRFVERPCDMTVAFGFMHHIPGEQRRERLLRSLVANTRSGGYVAVSFWCFLNDAGLAARALETHRAALADSGLSVWADSFDEGDYLLGWNNTPGAWRYCHHFDDAEVDRLVDAVSDVAEPIDRFSCDGRTGNLNQYIVLRVL